MTMQSNQLMADYKFRNIDVQHFSKDQINQLQLDLLQEHLKYLTKNSPFYKKHFQKVNVDISQIKKVEDLKIIPPTSTELATTYCECQKRQGGHVGRI